MPLALFAAMLTLGATPAAPLEGGVTSALVRARRDLSGGDRGRALATLDSLLFDGGLTVAMEAPGAMEPAVTKGLGAWNAALGETAFRNLLPGSTAQVTVRFVRSIDEEGADVQGFVRASREMSWCRTSHSYKVHATILVRDNVDGRPLRPEEVTNVVAHEAGHLLGLADAPRDDCLMGRMVVGRPLSGPTEGEVDAVRSYRGLIRQSYPKG